MPPDDDAQTLAMLRTVLDRAHLATPGQLSEVVQEAGRQLGWTVVVHLVDYEQRLLVPVPGRGLPLAGPQPVDGSLAGECFRRIEPVRWTGSTRGVWLPLMDGADRLGAMGIEVGDDVDLSDRLFEDRCRLLAHLTGHLIAAKSPYGDALTHVRRRRQRTVASELLWELLPPLTFGCDRLVVSAALEPSYGVAADAFDYSVVDDVAHLAVLDATGHDLQGTLLAAVALAAYRNGRRERRGLAETVALVDRLVGEQGRTEKFVTGVFAELDLSTGRLRYVNAGHPAPLLMRRGTVVKELSGGRRILLGLGDDEPQVAQEDLEPDDWIVLYTDGIPEARAPDGSFFGLDRLVRQLETSAAEGQPVPETLRRVRHEVLGYQQGRLQDDATLLVAQWATGEERRLVSASTDWAGSLPMTPSPERGEPTKRR